MKKCLRCSAPFESPDWRCPACGHQLRSIDGVVVSAPDLIDGDGTDAEYPFDVLIRAEASHFWFRSRARLVAVMIDKYFPQAASFLEVGAGAGGVLVELHRRNPNRRLVGSELLVRGLQHARRRLPGVELVQMDAQRIPFVSEFDAIGIFDVLEHIDDDRAALEQILAALVPGGGVIVTVPQHPWLWSAFDELSGHRRRYTRRELATKLSTVGFEILRMTSFTSFALPLLVASRLRRRTIDLDREFTVPAVLNLALTGVGSLERAVIQAGVSLPAGGSLLAVATRSS